MNFDINGMFQPKEKKESLVIPDPPLHLTEKYQERTLFSLNRISKLDEFKDIKPPKLNLELDKNLSI